MRPASFGAAKILFLAVAYMGGVVCLQAVPRQSGRENSPIRLAVPGAAGYDDLIEPLASAEHVKNSDQLRE
jgi:hypothetical protein